MNITIKVSTLLFALLIGVTAVDAATKEAVPRSIVPEEDRICNEKCKGIKDATEFEGCMIKCKKEAKAKKAETAVGATPASGAVKSK